MVVLNKPHTKIQQHPPHLRSHVFVLNWRDTLLGVFCFLLHCYQRDLYAMYDHPLLLHLADARNTRDLLEVPVIVRNVVGVCSLGKVFTCVCLALWGD